MEKQNKIMVEYALATIDFIEENCYRYSDGTDWYCFDTMEEATAKAEQDFVEIRNAIQERMNCSKQDAEWEIHKMLQEMLAD